MVLFTCQHCHYSQQPDNCFYIGGNVWHLNVYAQCSRSNELGPDAGMVSRGQETVKRLLVLGL